MGNFTKQLKQFEDETLERMTLAAQKITLDAFSEVILKTPVDTGRARGNWKTAIGIVPSGVVELSDPSGQGAISQASGVVTAIEIGDVIYLANDLPYITRLEEGSSQQAPGGMVRLTAQRFQAIANAVFAEFAT